MKTANTRQHVVLTGGGSGGHAMTALVMAEYLRRHEPDWSLSFVGSEQGLERELCQRAQIDYLPISTGKLRRYLTWENVVDQCRLLKGIWQSWRYLGQLSRPGRAIIIFSTGGYVALPLVVAAYLRRIPVMIHEQTSRAGLANRISGLMAKRIFLTFSSSAIFFPAARTVPTGPLLREQLWQQQVKPMTSGGSLKLGEKIFFFPPSGSTSGKPLLLILGGGNGSQLLNRVASRLAPSLLERYQMVIQAGRERKGVDPLFETHPDAYCFEFLSEGLLELIQSAQVIIARSGAATVSELSLLNKKVIYVPLAIAQKNEQYHNARAACDLTGQMILSEKEFEQLRADQLLALLDQQVDPTVVMKFSDGSAPVFLCDGRERVLNELRSIF